MYGIQVTHVQTFCQVFNNESTHKILLIEVHKSLRIYLKIPVTNLTTERIFCFMKD